METDQLPSRKQQLRKATHILTDYGLVQAARFTAELVLSLSPEYSSVEDQPTAPSSPLPDHVDDTLRFAKTLFDTREYMRCAHLLEPIDGFYPRVTFLALYSKFLAGEKRREEEKQEAAAKESEHNQGIFTSKSFPNPHLKAIRRTLAENEPSDAFGLYLTSIVLRESGDAAAAVSALVRSLSLFPWNWSAWLDLAETSDEKTDLSGLPDHYMRRFFNGYVASQRQQGEKSLELFRSLQREFPTSNFVTAQIAVAHQEIGRFADASKHFEQLRSRDPYRMEHMDVYSNILYVQQDRVELSHLAHDLHAIDKFRPESCIASGNFCAIRGNRHQAIIYFTRAIKLNPKCADAWVLIGHEYLELKNSAAAIQAYRRAIEIKPHDHRAWNGLGQMYEILQMHVYSLYYFQKLTTLKPYDARFWVSLGTCYEKLGKLREAIDCHERAESVGEKEGVSLLKLASLYSRTMQDDKAALCHERFVEGHQPAGMSHLVHPELANSLLFLAHHHKARGRLAKARDCCLKLLALDGVLAEKERAQALLRDIQSSTLTVPPPR